MSSREGPHKKKKRFERGKSKATNFSASSPASDAADMTLKQAQSGSSRVALWASPATPLNQPIHLLCSLLFSLFMFHSETYHSPLSLIEECPGKNDIFCRLLGLLSRDSRTAPLYSQSLKIKAGFPLHNKTFCSRQKNHQSPNKYKPQYTIINDFFDPFKQDGPKCSVSVVRFSCTLVPLHTSRPPLPIAGARPGPNASAKLF